MLQPRTTCLLRKLSLPVKEASIAHAFGFLVLLAFLVLEVAKVLFPQLHLFLKACNLVLLEHAGQCLCRLRAPSIRGPAGYHSISVSWLSCRSDKFPAFTALQVAKVLFPQLHLFLKDCNLVLLKHAGQGFCRLRRPSIRRPAHSIAPSWVLCMSEIGVLQYAFWSCKLPTSCARNCASSWNPATLSS